MASTEVIQVETDAAVAGAAKRGADALQAGRLVALATETVYGLAALATNGGAMERLREVKSRPDGPFTVHIGAAEEVKRYVRDVPWAARRLSERAWPGPVTMLLETGGRLADAKLGRARLHKVLCQENVIGLRCPDGAVVRAVLSGVDSPVVMPSANPAGAPPPRTADDVLATLDGQVDLVIDSGSTQYGKGSTIVRFAGDAWDLVRKGVYDERAIRKHIRRTYLFVCTGNTCRSPMAAGLARKLLADRLGCRTGELRSRGVEVASAGLFAAAGGGATPEAGRVARDRGADISRHRSRRLTSELINSADLIFCMTAVHAAEAVRLAPGAAGRIRRLSDEGDIPDPIGGGDEVYAVVADRIERAFAAYLDKELG